MVRLLTFRLGVRYPLQITSERVLVKRNNEMLEKALLPQKPGKRKIFLESGPDNYSAAGNMEHHVVQICNSTPLIPSVSSLVPAVTSSPKKRPISA